MSRLDELPPDQRAALSLLLRQHKSYAEVASMLGIAEHAVHDRAHVAIAVLAPHQARALKPQDRLEITDYILGQQPTVGERLRTRTLLGNSEPARAWALELAAQLAALGADLPDIPPASSQQQEPQQPQRLHDLSAAAASAASASTGVSGGGAISGGGATGSPAVTQVRSSRLGGAILLATIVVVVVVAVVLLGGGGKKSSTTKTSSTVTKTGPTVENQITLKPPAGPKSGSVGVVEVIAEKNKQAFFIEAQHIPESKGFYYAIWLYNSPSSALALSKSPSVGSTHRLAGGSLLPTNASEFHEILLTRETTAHPKHPGRVVLRGAFSLTG